MMMFNRQNLLIIGVVVAVLVAGSALWLSIRAGAWVEEATAIRTEIGSVDEKVVRTGAVIEGYRGRIDGLEVGLNSLANELSGMSGRIDANWTQYNQQIADILVRLSELKSTEDLQGDIADIERDIRKIQKELDLDDDDNDYGDEDLIAYYNGGNGFTTPPTWIKLYGDNWVGQQFETGSYDVRVEKVRAYFGRDYGDPESVTMEIYKVGSDEFPKENALCKDTVDAKDVEDWSAKGKWHTFDAGSCDLDEDTMYAVVFSSEDGNKSHFVWIGVDKTGTYKDGKMLESDEGDDWDKWWKNSGWDIGFEIIGVWE